MPQSQLSIINIGLAHLGQGAISDMNDTSAQGQEPSRLARLRWDELVEAVLVELPWNFAVTRGTATKLSTAPAWGYANAFPLDPDCLRVLECNGDADASWQLEVVDSQVCIVTDLDSPLQYRWIKRVTDVSQFSPAFVSALAARIAMEFAEPLTRDQAILENMTRFYSSKIQRARQIDSQERTPPVIDASTWTDARRRGIVQLAKLSGDPQPLGY